MLPENIKNFINSKDTVTEKNSVINRLIFLCLLLICCCLEILFYCFNINFMGKTTKLFDLIFAVIIGALGLANFVISLFVKNERFHYMYYGNIFLLVSVFMFYIATRIALFPLHELYGLLGIGLWIIFSLIIIWGISNNIKLDRYNTESSNIYWFNNSDSDKKYGIVFTKNTFISFIIVIALIIAIAILYFAVSPELFKAGDATFSLIWQVVFISCILVLGFISNFAWKLIIKQHYINKAVNNNTGINME